MSLRAGRLRGLLREPDEKLALVLILGVLAGACALSCLVLPAVHDEATNHFPLAEAFRDGFPVFSDAYPSAYTPFPYLIVGRLLDVLGPHIWVARLYNLLIGLLGVLGFRYLLRRLGVRDRGWALLVFALYPYYLRNCALFFMGNNAVVFAVWGVALCCRPQGHARYALGAVCCGLATLSGQYVLPVVAGLALAEVVGATEDWNEERRELGPRLFRILLLAACQVPTLLVFWGWGGFTHPAYEVHGLQLSGAHVTGIFFVLGVAFCCWILPRIRTGGLAGLQGLSYSLLTAPLFLICLPVVSVDQGIGIFPGLFSRSVAAVSSRLGWDSPLLMVPFAVLGVMVLVEVLRERSAATLGLRLGIPLLLIALGLSTQVGESNVATVVPFVLAVVCVRPISPAWRLAMVGQTAVLGVAYLLYLTFVKFAGVSY